jgi:cephalosporin-C deacetylase-like acetyl esterase
VTQPPDPYEGLDIRRLGLPPLKRAPDFESFWEKTRIELGRVAPNASSYPLESEDPALGFERLDFDSLGGVRVSGYAIRWKDGAPRPLVVDSHGYEGGLEPKWHWARAGVNVVGVEARGYGRSKGALPSPSPWGYVLTGIESPDYLGAHPAREEDLMLVLSYFDPMNFAGDVRCPTLVGLGMEDDAVPAPTVYAIADRLGGPHEVMELPVSHTERPEEKLWDRFEEYWLRLALEGVPADFGKKYAREP